MTWCTTRNVYGLISVARDRIETVQLVKEAAKADRWVIEGIYGALINEILSDSIALIWLCLDEAECVTNIRERGIRNAPHRTNGPMENAPGPLLLLTMALQRMRAKNESR